MPNNNQSSGARPLKLSQFNSPVCLAFVVSFVYWGYLLFASKMVIVYDAMAFERLGKMIYQSGLVEYFRTGPHNEPFFPLLIAFSMRVADFSSIPYQTIQA